jgi:uncharacterized glyoxalase superfamily protein PhnB
MPTNALPFESTALSTSLTVKDLRKSLAWYRDVFGFAVDQEYDRDGKVVAAVLRAGAVRVIINQDDGAKGWARVKGEGFALNFATKQSVDEVAKRIKDNGGTLTQEPADMPWGARIFQLVDPDGYKLVVSSEQAG